MIIISPSKKMSKSTIYKKVILRNEVIEIAKKYQKMSKEEMSVFFGIKNKTLEDTYRYYQEFNNFYYTAFDCYNGPVFKQISKSEYVYKNVYILSAMFGIVRADEKISLYRLDFSEKYLYQFHSDYVNEIIESKQNNQILLLCSSEYKKLIDNSNTHLIHTSFISNDKLNSIHIKKARGHIVEYLSQNNIRNYWDLVNMKTEMVKKVEINNDTIIFDIII